MLIAVLLYILTCRLSDDEHAPLVHDVVASIQRVVGDAQRAERLVALDRAMLEEQRDYQAALAALRERLLALYTDRLSTEADFATITGQIDDLRSALHERLASQRFAMRALLSPAEWQAIYGPVAAAAAPATSGR